MIILYSLIALWLVSIAIVLLTLKIILEVPLDVIFSDLNILEIISITAGAPFVIIYSIYFIFKVGKLADDIERDKNV